MTQPNEPYFLQTLTLAGFRAFLQPKSFDFARKRSLAVFAPNGNGKSSIVDGIEFVLSSEGTLERLGQRTVHNLAGPIALVHNRAEDAKIDPAVSVSFVQGVTTTSGSRAATGKRQMPQAAATVGAVFVVSPIVRGYDLRSFVEGQGPEGRYENIARWLQLGPLVDVQKTLRTLRSQIKTASEDESALRRLDALLARETAKAVAAWNDAAVLGHIHTTVLAPLGKDLSFSAVSAADPAYATLAQRARAEESQLGLAALRQLLSAAGALWAEQKDQTSGETTVLGAIHVFERAIGTLDEAVLKEAEERRKAAQAVFQSVWKAAQPLFEEDAKEIDACPVCETPLSATSAGSRETIRDHLGTHLAGLAEYAAAKKALDATELALTRAHARLTAALPTLVGQLNDKHTVLKDELTAYKNAADAWTKGPAPSSGAVTKALTGFAAELSGAIKTIEDAQGENTYAKAKHAIDRIIGIGADRAAEERTLAELVKLSDALTAQAAFVSGQIREKVQSLLDKLQTPMNAIYKGIQGDGATPIRLELPHGDDTNQQRLGLVIDFAANRLGVQPSGYLSDSQIHSLALALRLAAIREFNTGAPLMVLDDIVTSYDADHRRTISGMIGAMFPNMQVIITTHDERFFNYLKDQLPDTRWQYTRIIGIDPASGPRFADHKVTDEMIAARWDAGESAANEMRQAEEEWLLAIGRQFGVSLRIRPLEKPYAFERSELASALAQYLKGAKLAPAAVPGVANRFLTSLQKGEIENFGSHFQDTPYGATSIGDEKTRWKEFAAFRDQFTCPKCARTKFKRPYDLSKPVCAHEACETQFEFKPPPGGAPAA
jgi:hypothetical protein